MVSQCKHESHTLLKILVGVMNNMHVLSLNRGDRTVIELYETTFCYKTGQLSDRFLDENRHSNGSSNTNRKYYSCHN